MKRSSALQAEAKQFIAMARLVQDDNAQQGERDGRLLVLRSAYTVWYRHALALFAAHQRIQDQARFMKLYNGSGFSPKIKYFLKYGAKPYTYRGRWKGAPEWTAYIDRGFIEPLSEQVDLLAALGE